MKLFLVVCIPLVAWGFLEHAAAIRTDTGRERRRLWSQFAFGAILGLPAYFFVSLARGIAPESFRMVPLYVRLTLGDHLVPILIGLASLVVGTMPAHRFAFFFARLAGLAAVVTAMDALWLGDRSGYRLFLVPALRLAAAALAALGASLLERAHPRTIAVAVTLGLSVPLLGGATATMASTGFATLAFLVGAGTLIGAGALLIRNWEEALA